MTAKKVRCNKRDECGVRGCPCYKKHLHDWACCDGFCYASGLTVKCVPVKPRKPSPAKPTISMDMRKAHEEEWYGLRSADEKLDFVWSMLIKLAKKLEKVK